MAFIKNKDLTGICSCTLLWNEYIIFS